MVAIYLAPFYLLVCVYILLRSLHWFQVLHTVFRNVWVCRGIGLVYLFVVFSILIAFMAPASGFRRFMKLLSNYWLGVLMYTLMTLGIADGLRLLLKYPFRNFAFPGRELLFSNMGTAVVGAVCAVIISTVSIYGVLSAGNIHTTKYNISARRPEWRDRCGRSPRNLPRFSRRPRAWRPAPPWCRSKDKRRRRR